VAQQTANSRAFHRHLWRARDYSVALSEDVTGKLTGEVAHQTNYANNPLSISLNYWLGEGSVTYKGLTGLIGYEVLEGNGTIGFATPLATLHAFNGWADMFLTTPANGLKDFYLKAAYVLPADFHRNEKPDRHGVLPRLHHRQSHPRHRQRMGCQPGTGGRSPDLAAGQVRCLSRRRSWRSAASRTRSIFWLQLAYKY
jgi:hypothetical protein